MDEQMTTDNPAARALRILRTIDGMHKTTDAKTAWREALGIDGNDEGELLIKIGQFIAVPAEAVALMNEKFPALKPQTAAWHLKFTTALSNQTLNSGIHTFTLHYTSSANDFLEVMDQMLAISSSPELDRSVIHDFQQSLEDLIQDIVGRSVEPKVKEYLVKSLRKVISALDDYHIKGVVPVIESIEIVAGHLFTDSNFKDSLGSDLGNKLFSVLGAVANGVTVATGAPPSLWSQLSQSVQGLLPQSS